ncbi:hypothetical protein [Deinococcus aquiradiocola]|uniref:Uncharacterized protein n=1 Tax=Deinococcus aquiradiocola TaxID=393059 RepID=A0A917PP72_9DEIO|nr:hypothetical protein [Deinococcus aquiradiocola]GGJ86503.1 hypothetical protein GCM10008939_33040 [Deinococcus aquiradiocola]
MNDDAKGSELAPDGAELSTISNLSSGLPGTLPETRTPAEQGDAPADLAERAAPHVPAPSREHLNAEQVERLTGTHSPQQGEESTDASNALDRAEGRTPDTED